ncbi:hypothetical protein BKA58DRAFT_397771 [Alternaria rosae]|uniref:uncharacterized protein n=1 Tax=Alternaria rosae TaxID=1187941 RepID=UPI001E8CCE0C|nr:uncharacterized protein BKA58DRAFT_397771 [Alternaria rosae]KAH6877627.1 hypothetical protein BKA58DRAFT_397771 [Alternaria rosae]
MRRTLRRSCDACARSKLSCDLRTPECSRCRKRKASCVYVNEPLTSSSTENISSNYTSRSISNDTITSPALWNHPANKAFDPFDTYPATRLPRARVQQLIIHFLSNIAFQYYPLDLDAMSNPFVVSWWPLALQVISVYELMHDSALFHVSLQTASLDIEMRAQNGFENSEVLMADSISLVRRRVEDPFQAYEDETMNSVVTLAAIEV